MSPTCPACVAEDRARSAVAAELAAQHHAASALRGCGATDDVIADMLEGYPA